MLAKRQMLLLSGLSKRFGMNQVMPEASTSTRSGRLEEPAILVQPVATSQRRDLTMVRVVFCQAQAKRISPLWRRTAAGYLPSPEESSVVGVPKVNPVILFEAPRCIVTGMSVIMPDPEPPPAKTRSEVKDTRTGAG